MAIDLNEVNSESNDSSSNSSSNSSNKSNNSSSRDSSQYYDKIRPHRIIRIGSDGNLEAVKYPNTPAVEKAKSQPAPKDEDIPVEWKRWWWTRNTFNKVDHDVEQTYGESLDDLLDKDPQEALDALVYTAKNLDKSARKRDTLHINCAICNKELHKVKGDYQTINNRRVCSSHTTGQLAEHDIL